MITPELVTYVKSELGKGVSEDSLRATLVQAGWASEDVTEAVVVVKAPSEPIAPTISPAYSVNGANLGQPGIHHKSKLIPSIILGLALILIVGGIGYAYPKFFPSQSENIEALVATNAYNAKTAKFDYTINVKTTLKQGGVMGTSLMPGLDNIIIRATGMYDTEVDKTQMDVSFSMKGFQILGEIRVFGRVLYATLKSAPATGFFDLSAYQNKWFSLDVGKMETDAQAMLPASYLNSGSSLNNSLTEEQRAKLIEITKNASFIKIAPSSGVDMIEGVKTTHHTFVLDREGITAYFAELEKLLSLVLDPRGQNPVNFNAAVTNQELDKLKNFTGEIWVGEKDKFPYKLTVSFSTDLMQGLEILGTTEINIFVTMKDWNVPVNITAPEGAQDLQELVKLMVPTSVPSMQNGGSQVNSTNTNDALIVSTFTAIQAKAGNYYFKQNPQGYSGFCLDFDTQMQISRMNQTLKKVYNYCKDAQTAFMLSAPLSDGKYYCVDNNRTVPALAKAPSGMECK